MKKGRRGRMTSHDFSNDYDKPLFGGLLTDTRMVKPCLHRHPHQCAGKKDGDKCGWVGVPDWCHRGPRDFCMAEYSCDKDDWNTEQDKEWAEETIITPPHLLRQLAKNRIREILGK